MLLNEASGISPIVVFAVVVALTLGLVISRVVRAVD